MSKAIDRLRALLEEATPEPWTTDGYDMYVFGSDGHPVVDRMIVRGRGHGAEVSGRRREGQGEDNLRAIAVLRSVAPQLLAVVEAAEADWRERGPHLSARDIPLYAAVERCRDAINAHLPAEPEASDGCPQCGAPEAESSTPWTTYACGASDYDQRPDTFLPCGEEASDG